MGSLRTLDVGIDWHVFESTSEICYANEKMRERISGFTADELGMALNFSPCPSRWKGDSGPEFCEIPEGEPLNLCPCPVDQVKTVGCGTARCAVPREQNIALPQVVVGEDQLWTPLPT